MLVLGKYIDEYFQDKPIGHCEILEQVVDCIDFFHCQKEENFVTKIMLCHGVLTRVEAHDTPCAEQMQMDQGCRSNSNILNQYHVTTKQSIG